MKSLMVCGIAVFFGMAFASPQPSQTDVAITSLQKSHSAAKWNGKSAVLAEVTCEGQPDTVVFGSEKGKVVVAVVSGSNPNKIQFFTFPVRRDTQDGFCAFPTRISTAPLNCEAEGGTLSGCKPVKGCQEFTVDDDGCDPFNFYWDSSHQTVQWWRE
jgi:hypothetical protein